MIVSLTGSLRDKDAAGCTIECGGVGYGVEMSAHGLAQLGPVGEPCNAYIHTHVAETELRLFGFVERSEKQAFVALLAASGVGPKLALTILSTLSTAELYRAVLAREVAALVAVPGIGKKKAERLMLDLEGRLAERIGASLAAAGTQGAPFAAGVPTSKLSHVTDAVSALVHLGFAQAVAEQAAAAADHTLRTASAGSAPGAEPDVAQLIRLALQSLTPR